MGNTLLKNAESGDAGVRLDVFVQNLADITRNAAQNLILAGDVFVNGKTTHKAGLKLSINDAVKICLPEPVILDILPQNIPLEIIFEDSDLIVVNKQKGMVVHPAPGHTSGTLVNALMHHCGDSLSGINGVMRPGIVHRIDKETSGLLVAAKNDRAHNTLAEQFAQHSINREYVAIVHGRPKNPSGTIDAPLARHKTHRKKMATDPSGKRAVTHYEVIQEFKGFSLIRAKLETGRTHQIRVHMAHIGHPVLGDAVYTSSKQTFGLSGQALHARLLGFVHPNGDYLEFAAEPPLYFSKIIEKFQTL